jgi:hypothetical protein
VADLPAAEALIARGQHRKYHWSDALRADLVLAYAGKKTHLSAALDSLQRRTGWPRSAILSKAHRLGLSNRPWSPEETAYLEEAVGRVSARQIAKRLKRSPTSVNARARKLGLSRRCQEGYTQTDLEVVFGVNDRKVRCWMQSGKLGPVRNWNGHRVSADNVKRFISSHYKEYDLRRVDQDWLKMMLFEDGNGAERWL